MGVNKGSIKEISIVSVGAGNLAVNLVNVLYRKGFRILQIYSRTEEPARILARRVNAGWTIDPGRIIANADLYIISLKDSAFVDLLPQIVSGKKQDALFIHTAGSIPMSIWETKAERYGVLYPLQTFSKEREVDFNRVPFFVEAGNADDVLLLKTIAGKISDKVYEINSRQRKSLHLAAVFACNFTNHLYALAADILEKNRLPFDVLLPLINETARKVHEVSPAKAQTGPAVRCDENVMNDHLEMLAGDPSMRQIYKVLSDSIHGKSKE